MEILLTPDQENTISAISNVIVNGNGDRYMYMPYYFKAMGNGIYNQLRFDQLPEDIKDKLLSNQGIKLPTE